jgi:hypothetical protein
MLGYGSKKETFVLNFKITQPFATTVQILVGFSQFLHEQIGALTFHFQQAEP